MSSETDVEGSVSTKDIEMTSDKEEVITEVKDVKETSDNQSIIKMNSFATCHCNVMDRQQREIVSLKRKLQEKDVYGSPSDDVHEYK